MSDRSKEAGDAGGGAPIAVAVDFTGPRRHLLGPTAQRLAQPASIAVTIVKAEARV